jgi:hypothetical protein
VTDPANEGEEAHHQPEISLLPRADGKFELRFSAGGESLVVSFEPAVLPQIVGLMMSSSVDIASKLEDLNETPFLAVVDPVGRIERDDAGGIVYTFKPNAIRPFMVKLSRERALELHRALSHCLDI